MNPLTLEWVEKAEGDYRTAGPRIHSLAELLAIIAKNDPAFLLLQQDLGIIESYAVQFRYPGLSADKAEAQTALLAAGHVRSFIRTKLDVQ